MSSKDIAVKKKVPYALSAAFAVLFFGFSFFYMELVFKYSVSARVLDFSVFYFLIFSFLTGSIIAFLVYMLPSVLAHITAAITLVLTTIGFLIEFFIQREFFVFYDINTILNAATDALGGFGADIRALIFCYDGITHILLFVVPLVLYAVFGRKIVSGIKKADEDASGKTLNNRGRRYVAGLIAIGTSLLSLSLILILISVGKIGEDAFGYRFSFQNSVFSYGLASSLARDVRNIGKPSVQDDEFVIVDIPYADPIPVPVPVTDPVNDPLTVSVPDDGTVTDTTPEPVVYGVNALDIDFAALAEEGGSYRNLNTYVASLTPSSKNEYTGLFEGKNLIVFCAEAFSSGVIDPELTPALYRLTTKGINFTDYYEQATAGTTGGEFQLIYGLMPMRGGDSMLAMTAQGSYTNIGAVLSTNEGYYGMAFHDNDDLYYSRNITHNLLGYSEGFMGYGNGMEKLISRHWPESDCEMMEATLPLYSDHQPFNIYYMTVSGHCGYDFHSNAMSVRNKDLVEAWCEENDLTYSQEVKAYIACQLELEKALAYTLEYLEENDMADDTVIVLAPDHFPYGLTNGGYLGNLPLLDELYGYKVNTQMDRDKNTAIIWCGVLEDMDPIIIDKPTSPLDILPTLLNLFGCEWDSRLYIGRDVLSDAEGLYFDSGYNWKTEVGYYRAATGVFTPNPGYEEVGEAYIRRLNAIVANKISFNRSVINTPYFPYVYSILAEQRAQQAADSSQGEDEY